MKVFAAILLSCLLAQALALPADPAHVVADPAHAVAEPEYIVADPAHMVADPAHAEPEERIQPKNDDTVEAFRDDIEYWFNRFNNFYDRNNAHLSEYRMNHVDLVTRTYNEMVTVFGRTIQDLNDYTEEIRRMVAERQEELGEDNECLQGALEEYDTILSASSIAVQRCATTANATMETHLRDMFYREFAEIQNTVSEVPLSVIDVLSRGNALSDEQEIITYLRNRYHAYDLQWLGMVSQLLGWESNRFRVLASFLIDDSNICNANALINHILNGVSVMIHIGNCQ